MMKRRCLLAQSLLFLTGCLLTKPDHESKGKPGKLTVGVVTYGEESHVMNQYQRLIQSLQESLETIIELEPAYNELKALEQIEQQKWSIVFAPAGLAAISMSKANYKPIFPLQGNNDSATVLVVRQDSPLQTMTDLDGQSLGLGQPGSAAGYYVPLYELYGKTLAEIQIAPTPGTLLEWIAQHKVAVGALAKHELEQYRSKFAKVQFRVIHTSRPIPQGSVLVSPSLDQNQQQLIQASMSQVVPAIAQEAGYITNAQPPNYKTLMAFIEKIKPIETRIRQKPAQLYQPGELGLQ
jgi:phosphonate transport system substrate-binding protein